MSESVQRKNDNNSKGGIYEIDLGDVSNGVYFVRIKTDEESIVHRVTVTK